MDTMRGIRSLSEHRSASPWTPGVAVTVLLITLLSVVVHVTSPSTWHHSEESWAGRVEKHETSPIFSKRPLTTGGVNLLHDVLGFSYRETFFVLQFLLMAVALMCFYHWLLVVGFGRLEALTGMIVFGLSHSVFLAHFEPVFTWSDFWVYALVPLSLAASLKRSHTIAIGMMVLALIARETSVLFVPLMVWALRLGGSRYWRALLSGAAVITLFIAERLYLQPELSAAPDFKLAFNFAGPLRTSDTIYSFIVSLGFVWITGILGLFAKEATDRHLETFLRWGGVWTVAGFTASSFLFGQVRESRLFVPAMAFMIPLTIVWWRSRHAALTAWIKVVPRWAGSIVVFVLLFTGIGVAKLIFPEFEYRAWRDGSWIWLGLNLAVMAMVVAVEAKHRGIPRRP